MPQTASRLRARSFVEASMSSCPRSRDARLDKGVLPPFREFFLEIEVNKLIRSFLLSSNADDLRTSALSSHGDDSPECKENIASSALLDATQKLTVISCNAPHEISARPYHELRRQCSAVPLHSQRYSRESGGPALQNFPLQSFGKCSSKEYIIPFGAQKSVNAYTTECEASSVALTVDNEGRKVAYLTRADTFPRAYNAEFKEGVPFKAKEALKACTKKPPRPPKLPNSNKLRPCLNRCFSDMGTFSQCSRRAKSEKKRPSASTPLWAFMFTFCFVVIMICQGFVSQNNQESAAFSEAALSLFDEHMNTSKLIISQEDFVAVDSKSPKLTREKVDEDIQMDLISRHAVK